MSASQKRSRGSSAFLGGGDDRGGHRPCRGQAPGIEVVLIDAGPGTPPTAAKAHSGGLPRQGQYSAPEKVKRRNRKGEVLGPDQMRPPNYASPSRRPISSSRLCSRTGAEGRGDEGGRGGGGPDCIFSHNTRPFRLTELAKASATPETLHRQIHFFSPVEQRCCSSRSSGAGRRGPRRSPKERSISSRQIRKTPIVVNEARILYANRCIIYLNDWGSGWSVRAIRPRPRRKKTRPLLVRNAPWGGRSSSSTRPLDRPQGVRIAIGDEGGHGGWSRFPDEAVDEVLFRLAGRKAGSDGGRRRGFMPTDGRRKALWPLGRASGRNTALAEEQPELTEVQHRLLFAQVLEAVRALEEGGADRHPRGRCRRDPSDGGFVALVRSGRSRCLDMIGAERAVALAGALEAKHGARFGGPRTSQGDGRFGRDILRPLLVRRPRRPRRHRRASGPAGGGRRRASPAPT